MTVNEGDARNGTNDGVIKSKSLIVMARLLFRRYREQILYLVFGFATTVVNLVTFWVSFQFMPPLVANVFAWVVGVVFAYATNRKWVFGSESNDVAREALAFAGGRLMTLGIEEAVLWIGIDVLDMNTMLVKVFAQVLVIVGNYVVSKYLVFR